MILNEGVKSKSDPSAFTVSSGGMKAVLASLEAEKKSVVEKFDKAIAMVSVLVPQDVKVSISMRHEPGERVRVLDANGHLMDGKMCHCGGSVTSCIDCEGTGIASEEARQAVKSARQSVKPATWAETAKEILSGKEKDPIALALDNQVRQREKSWQEQREKRAKKLVGLQAKVYRRLLSYGKPMTAAMMARRIGKTKTHATQILTLLSMKGLLLRIKRGVYQVR